jgi:hypothetical protein
MGVQEADVSSSSYDTNLSNLSLSMGSLLHSGDRSRAQVSEATWHTNHKHRRSASASLPRRSRGKASRRGDRCPAREQEGTGVERDSKCEARGSISPVNPISLA